MQKGGKIFMKKKSMFFILVIVLIIVFFSYKVIDYNKIYLFSEVFSEYVENGKITSIKIECSNINFDKKIKTNIYRTTDEKLIKDIYNDLSILQFKKNININQKYSESTYFDEISIRTIDNKNNETSIFIRSGVNNTYIDINIHKNNLNTNETYEIVSDFYNFEFINNIIKKMPLVFSN